MRIQGLVSMTEVFDVVVLAVVSEYHFLSDFHDIISHFR